MIQAIIDGGLISRWVYRKLVDLPIDALSNARHPGESTPAMQAIANVIRKAPYLPLKTPWNFVLGHARRDCLQLPSPASRMWLQLWLIYYSVPKPTTNGFG